VYIMLRKGRSFPLLCSDRVKQRRELCLMKGPVHARMERVSVYRAGFARVYIFSGMKWETLTLTPECWKQDWSRFMSSCHSQNALISSLNCDFSRKRVEPLLKRCCLFDSQSLLNAAACLVTVELPKCTCISGP
jgi:hypothetical protein